MLIFCLKSFDEGDTIYKKWRNITKGNETIEIRINHNVQYKANFVNTSKELDNEKYC